MNQAAPALASLIIPGLGQVAQGRPIAGLLHFLIACIVWVCTCGTCGWLVHVASAFGAAGYRK